MWNPIILDVECIVCKKSLQKINHNPHKVSLKMGKIVNRRSRTPNWSVEEKKYLLDLIRDRKDIVVNKSNNGPNLYEEKDQAWNDILHELTTKFGNKFHTFTIKKVKTQWQNMKRIAREEISLNGPLLHKFSRQSYEVCSLLDLIQDGVLLNPNTESENVLNDTSAMTTNVEIKTERMDEDLDNIPLAQALLSRTYRRPTCTTETQQNQDNAEGTSNGTRSHPTNVSETSSVSEQISDSNDFEIPQDEISHDEMLQGDIPQAKMPQDQMAQDDMAQGDTPQDDMPQDGLPQDQDAATRSFSTNTENSYFVGQNDYPFRRGLQRFLSFTNEEKQLKLQTLKEERQVVRAMRETAELNKIIAEQRLKHVLWVKRQEMGMYSGEPGSGAGRGGGGGGAIREAGGAFGKMEAAREDEYFYRKQKEQLATLHSHLNKEISFHEEQIKRHEDAIKRHKQQMATTADSKK